MKKTPLKRKTPLRAKAPMKSNPIKKTNSKKRIKVTVSKKYLEWVKTLPCCVCGGPADDPHHLIGIGNMGGMGMKAPDSLTMPVCRRDHDLIHSSPELWPQQWEWIVRTIEKATRAGAISIN